MNTDAPWPDLDEAEWRVLKIQTKLHQWAIDDPDRRFDDLFNLVCDPAFLVVAWDRVHKNRGARSAGVDGVAPRSIIFGKEVFLTELRDDLKARRFAPLPVREKLIPKKGGKFRGLGIPTARDRTVQAAMKLVLEPIFEADFKPCSYGFRPRRRAQDAIEEIFFYTTHSYEWVLEGDIKSCFDEISHVGLMDRLRNRIGDKRVLALVKAFLKAGILGEDQVKGTRSPAFPRVGFSHPCWLTSPCRCSTSTSWGDGSKRGPPTSAGRGGSRGWPTTGSSATRTILSSWSAAPKSTPNPAGRGGSRSRPDGLAPIGREDGGHPHRQGVRLFGFPHPAETPRRNPTAHHLHLPGQDRLAAIKAKVRVLTQGNTDQTLANLFNGSTRC